MYQLTPCVSYPNPEPKHEFQVLFLFLIVEVVSCAFVSLNTASSAEEIARIVIILTFLALYYYDGIYRLGSPDEIVFIPFS